MNGVFLLDKPAGLTSMQAVTRVKRALGVRKAGHTGTLDPLATGVLAICLGQATRIAPFLLASAKAYRATMRLGATTDTLDSDGQILTTRTIPDGLDEDLIQAVFSAFVGPISQVPPAFSALRVNGKRAHQLAREGKEVKLEARDVTIHALEIEAIRLDLPEGPEIDFSCEVSKGTYIRSLIRDIGETLECGAYMTALRRTSVGPFHLDEALPLEQLELDPQGAVILSMGSALEELPILPTTAPERKRLSHGCITHSLHRAQALSDGPHRVLHEDGELLALLEHQRDSWKIIRVFA